MKVSEIAKKCGYEYCGADEDVKLIAFARDAGEECIAIAAKKRDISGTKARVVLTEPTLMPTEKTLLFAPEPLDAAAVKIAKLFLENGDVKGYQRADHISRHGYYTAENAVIGEGSVISPNVFIGEDVKIGDYCTIDPNVQIKGGTVIGSYVHISSGSVIGADSFCHCHGEGMELFPGIGKVVVGDCVDIGYNTIVQRGTFSDTAIGQGSKIGNLIDIGHDVRIGCHCKIVSQTGIAGNAEIGDYVQIYGQVGIANYVTVGDHAIILAKSLVTKNVSCHKTVSGMYAREHREELSRQAEWHKLSRR